MEGRRHGGDGVTGQGNEAGGRKRSQQLPVVENQRHRVNGNAVSSQTKVTDEETDEKETCQLAALAGQRHSVDGDTTLSQAKALQRQ